MHAFHFLLPVAHGPLITRRGASSPPSSSFLPAFAAAVVKGLESDLEAALGRERAANEAIATLQADLARAKARASMSEDGAFSVAA